MSKDIIKKSGSGRGMSKGMTYIGAFLIEIAVSAVFIMHFALVIYMTGSTYRYASVFATVSVGAGAFTASFFLAGKTGSKGWLAGMIVGGVTFLVITAVSLIINQNGASFNTLFHFIIIMLASVIGGIAGVNKATNKKYI